MGESVAVGRSQDKYRAGEGTAVRERLRRSGTLIVVAQDDLVTIDPFREHPSKRAR